MDLFYNIATAIGVFVIVIVLNMVIAMVLTVAIIGLWKNIKRLGAYIKFQKRWIKFKKRYKECHANSHLRSYPCIDFLRHALHWIEEGEPDVAYTEICFAIMKAGLSLDEHESTVFHQKSIEEMKKFEEETDGPREIS